MRKVKIKNLSKSLKNGSLNQRVLFAVIDSARKAGKGLIKIAGIYGYLLGDFDMASVYQKVYGTFDYHKREEQIRKERIQKWQIKQAIKDLSKMNYIKINKDSKRVYLIDKGALELLKFKLLRSRPEWDKKWRIIIFDIPENRRQQRDFLRKRLKWLGFKELQKSAWIFPYDIKKEVEELLTICNFDSQEGDIRFLTVEKMENDKDLKKYFDL